MLTGILIGTGVTLAIVLLIAYWWTNGNIFKYIWFITVVSVMRLFGHNPFM